MKSKTSLLHLIAPIACSIFLLISCVNQSENNETQNIEQASVDSIEPEPKQSNLQVDSVVNKEESYTAAELFRRYNQSVFKLYVVDQWDELKSTGTGFLIGNNGYAVTNYHVLKDAHKAYVEMIDGRVVDILSKNIVGYDQELDYAIFKLETKSRLIGFEDYSDVSQEIGTKVFVIGNPAGGTTNTVSEGIISGQTWKDYQISAPIDHGSSGSPVFNNKGKVVGLVWGGKHEGNLYRAVKITQLQLDRFINHDRSEYREEDDPKLAGPFIGEFAKNRLIWALGNSHYEAVQLMENMGYPKISELAIDGNGVVYSINKYHDSRYGLVDFWFSYANHFGKDEVGLHMKLHGESFYSKDLVEFNLDRQNEIFSLVLKLDNGKYISIMAKYDEAQWRKYQISQRVE